MNENQPIRQASRGCLVSLASILLAICALALSANYLYPAHPACRGMLGGGFPLLFLCDAWGGGSPTGSWEKIDFVDVINGGIRPVSFLLDFLFYLVLIWMVWFLLANIFHKGINRLDLWWGTFILLGFVAGFLFAFVTIRPGDLYLREFYVRTATPVLPSPTALESATSLPAAEGTPTP